MLKNSQSEIHITSLSARKTRAINNQKKTLKKNKRQGMDYVQFGNFEDLENNILFEDSKWVPSDDFTSIAIIRMYHNDK